MVLRPAGRGRKFLLLMILQAAMVLGWKRGPSEGLSGGVEPPFLEEEIHYLHIALCAQLVPAAPGLWR